MPKFEKDFQYYKFGFYGLLKNLRLFEPFLILFFLSVGLTYFQIGILYSFREISINIMEIPAGVYADISGRRRSMIISFSAYILSFIIFFLSNRYFFFFIAMFMFAIGDAFRTGTHKAMIFDYLKIKGWEKYKVDYYGHTRAFSQFGSAISSLVAGALVYFTGNFKSIFIITIIPYVLDLILLSSYPKYLDGEISNIKGKNIISRFKMVTKDFLLTFRQISMLKAVISISLFAGYYKTAKDFIQPIIVSFALGLPILLKSTKDQKSSVVVGFVYFIIFLLTALFAKKSDWISTKFSSLGSTLNNLLYIGLFSGLLAGVIFQMEIYYASILFFIPVFIIENIRQPVGIAFIADNSENNVLATVLSVESQLETIAIIIAAPIMGFLSDKFGLGFGIILTTILFLIVGKLTSLKN